jgi:hypothetical protein
VRLRKIVNKQAFGHGLNAVAEADAATTFAL